MTKKMTKKGSFSNAYRAPDKGEGLDWDLVMHHGIPKEDRGEPLPKELQLDLDDIDRRNRGLQNNYENRKAQKGSGGGRPVKNPGIGQGRHQVIDIDELVRLYTQEHKKPEDIAPLVGIKTATTVIKYLKRAGVYEPNKYKLGSPHYQGKPAGRTRSPESYDSQRKGWCQNGHDLSKHGVQRWKNGKGGVKVSNGRECLLCLKDKAKRLRKAKKDG